MNKLDRQIEKIISDAVQGYSDLILIEKFTREVSQIKQSILKVIMEEIDKQEYIYDFKKFIKEILTK